MKSAWHRILPRLFILLLILVGFALFTPWLLHSLDRYTKGSDLQLALEGVSLVAAPLVVLLVFELISGRVLGWGFRFIRRAKEAREYWTEFGFHCFIVVAVVTTIFYEVFRGR